MISATPVVDGTASHMPYDPFVTKSSAVHHHQQQQSVAEFLRPLPKPAVAPRYKDLSNGDITRVNGCRIPRKEPPTSVTSARSYRATATLTAIPEEAVNLVQKRVSHDDASEINGDDSHPTYLPVTSTAGFNSRLYAQFQTANPSISPYYPPHTISPYGSLYPNALPASYAPLLARPAYPPVLSEAYTTPVVLQNQISRSTFIPGTLPLSASTPAYSAPRPAPAPAPPPASPPKRKTTPPSVAQASAPTVKPGQSVLRERRVSSVDFALAPQDPPANRCFKVPTGKEGSLKHRILTRPPEQQQQQQPRQAASPKRRALNSAPSFAKGSLIQLASGEFRRVEDMRTEDFVSSAERCPGVRLDPSTVVRIEENHSAGNALLTLSVGSQRSQVEVDTSVEHPFFVYSRGWASCSPERTMQCFGLSCHKLQVGDVCVSLTPQPETSSSTSAAKSSSTTGHQSAHHHGGSRQSASKHKGDCKVSLPPPPPPTATSSQDSAQASSNHPRKRRWSAPDQFCNDDVVKRTKDP